MSVELTPDLIIDLLGLEPHPEGGRFRETWVGPAAADGRASGTAIYFLLTSGESSHWHRVDSAEIWHHYAGAPLEISTWAEGAGIVEIRTLGPGIGDGERPQMIIEPFEWQSARTLGAWTLVGCTVSPGFDFEHFELAPPLWVPPV